MRGSGVRSSTSTRRPTRFWLQPFGPSDDAHQVYELDYADDGLFLLIEYRVWGRVEGVDETNVETAVFECAVEASIADERNGPSMSTERGGSEGTAYVFATSTDVSGCFE
jgi:hypothetical protein